MRSRPLLHPMMDVAKSGEDTRAPSSVPAGYADALDAITGVRYRDADKSEAGPLRLTAGGKDWLI